MSPTKSLSSATQTCTDPEMGMFLDEKGGLINIKKFELRQKAFKHMRHCPNCRKKYLDIDDIETDDEE